MAAQAAEYVPGEVIVRFKPSTDADERRQARAAVDGDFGRSLAIPRTQLIEVQGSVPTAVTELERRDDVAYAHPNYIWRMSATPGDPRYGELYAMNKIAAPAAWDVTKGSSGVTVAVIDSGVDMDHPDLNANIWLNPGEGAGKQANGVDDDGNGKVDDWRGWDFTDGDNDPHDGAAAHGTHVAGTIGARGDNGVGITGVNWTVKLMALRVGKDDASINMAAAVDAVDYAGRMGANVVNMSFGGGVSAGQPIPQAQLDAIKRHPQMLFVIAAGNETNDNDGEGKARYPCNFASEPNAICVAATDKNDALAEYSNFGPKNVQLAAPGSSILSTQPLAQIHDDFDTEVPGRWKGFDEPLGGLIAVAPGKWARTTDTKHSGTHSYTDTPGAFTDAFENSGIELTTPVSTIYDTGADGGTHHCYVDFWWRPRPDRNPLISPLAQNFHVDTLDPAFPIANSWFDTATLNMSAFADSWQHANVVFIPGHLLKDKIRVRLRVGIFNVSTGDGVYLDDVKIWCGPPVPPEYKELDGTSMATPHVAGVAALVKAQFPNATPAEIKQRLLGSVEVLPGLAGKVATGGRLNAARALAYAGPPETLLQDGPQGEITDTTPSFAFGVGNAAARVAQFSPGDVNVKFECQVDAAAFAPCTSPYTTPELPLGAHTFTVKALDPGGNADATPETRSFTIVPPDTDGDGVRDPSDGCPTEANATADGCPGPVMSLLKLTPSSFLARKKGASVVAKGGSVVSYALSEPATVAFGVERKYTGRKSGGKCVKQTRKNRQRKKCRLWKSVKGSFIHAGILGSNSFRFSGRLGAPLVPAAYRLTGVATDSAELKSQTQRVGFTIKKTKPKN